MASSVVGPHSDEAPEGKHTLMKSFSETIEDLMAKIK
jgi:hypothetical protein